MNRRPKLVNLERESMRKVNNVALKAESNLLGAIVTNARGTQVKQTCEAIVMLATIPDSPEKNELLQRLKIADQKIKTQFDFVEKLTRIITKYA